MDLIHEDYKKHLRRFDICHWAHHGLRCTRSTCVHRFESILQVAETIEVPATAAGPIEEMTVRKGELISVGQILGENRIKRCQDQVEGSSN